MNFKSQALDLATILNKTTDMWNFEIMNSYPESIPYYPQEWLVILDSLTDQELYEIDCKIIIDKIKDSPLAHLMQQIKILTQLPTISDSPEIPLEDWAFNGVKKKKYHEIQKIVPVIKKIRDEIHFNSVVDVGGGVGHLSRILSHYHGIPSISLDRDPHFQKIGMERLKKYRKLENSAEVEFINLNFGKDESPDILKNIFKPSSLNLGLHTCGALANALINTSIKSKSKALLSFGCCYHSLNPDIDFPMSEFYKTENLPRLNLYSLTLATRAHSAMTLDNYRTKERVKYYRYALHLFLMKHYNSNHFLEVGECPVKIYWQPFADYIRSRLVELKIEHTFSDEDFNQFYQNDEIQKQLRVMFLCNIIRWQLGRALEVYLLLDRALFLAEQGFEVYLEQYFDEGISPRNIGILATKK